jgi:ankyrin repeat protein
MLDKIALGEIVLNKIVDGRTDLVFEYMAQGHTANSKDVNGVSLIQWCAYYGDVSAIKYLLANGESPAALAGELNAAAFHGHWRLCQFLIELGQDVNQASSDTEETPLHAALCKSSNPAHDRVVRILLANAANPNSVTKPGIETGAFMRDSRTKGETPLHRAAAFGSAESIQLLLDAGARKDAKDVNGDSPLAWGSWYLRPDAILRKLCYDNFSIRADRATMEVYLLGEPHV